MCASPRGRLLLTNGSYELLKELLADDDAAFKFSRAYGTSYGEAATPEVRAVRRLYEKARARAPPKPRPKKRKQPARGADAPTEQRRPVLMEKLPWQRQ